MKTMKNPFREMLTAVPADLFELYHYSLLFRRIAGVRLLMLFVLSNSTTVQQDTTVIHKKNEAEKSGNTLKRLLNTFLRNRYNQRHTNN